MSFINTGGAYIKNEIFEKILIVRIDEKFYKQRGDSYSDLDVNGWGIEVKIGDKIVNSNGNLIEFITS
jgi:hypothetical protein